MAGIDDLLKALGFGDNAQTPAQPRYSFLGSNGKTYDHIPTEKEKFLAAQDTSWANEYGGTTPFYPQQRYIDKNLAPERGITNRQLEALAQANQQALKSGLMSPSLASKMLPTLLTEGASGTRGWGYPDTEKYRAILQKAGLPPNYEEALDQMKNRYDPYEAELFKAKMMHAMMAAKADLYGEDKAVERWNGKGRWLKASPDTKGADSEGHARKVAEAERLLAHPKNKEMMDTWNMYSKRHSGGQDVPAFSESPTQFNWEDDLPMIVGGPISALREALPNVSLKDVQQAVRNWTAPQQPVKKKKGGLVDKPVVGGNKLI